MESAGQQRYRNKTLDEVVEIQKLRLHKELPPLPGCRHLWCREKNVSKNDSI